LHESALCYPSGVARLAGVIKQLVLRHGDERRRVFGKLLDDERPVMSESYFARLYNGYVPERLEDKFVRLCRAFPDDAEDILLAWAADREEEKRIDLERVQKVIGRSFGKPREPDLPVPSSKGIDWRFEAHEALRLLLDNTPVLEDRRTIVDALQRIRELGWPTCRRNVNLALEASEKSEANLRKFLEQPPATAPPAKDKATGA
jgi:hypothetical protein